MPHVQPTFFASWSTFKKWLRPNKSQLRSLRVVQVVEKGWLAARESVETRH